MENSREIGSLPSSRASMASTLPLFLPHTRSGRTFFIASTMLGAVAVVQLLVLAGYLLRSGITARPAAEIHFAESVGTASIPLTAPTRPQLAAPTPAPIQVAPVEPVTVTESAAIARPTPATVARNQAGSGDLLEQARQLRTHGDMNSALARLREAQVAEPDNPQIVAEMALTYEAMQIPDRAFEQWQRLYNQGEGIGALYYLADSKLHSAPTRQVNAAVPTATNRDGQTAASEASILKLTDIHAQDLTDPSVEQKVSLKIVVKNRPGTVIDPTKVRILTYFYDLVDGKDTVLTDAQTDFAWLTPAPVNWANDKSEVLETTYLRPKAAPAPVPAKEPEAATRAGKSHARRGKGDAADVLAVSAAGTPAPVRVYRGYTVRLYYDRQLQDAQADPITLLQQFPPPVTLPNE